VRMRRKKKAAPFDLIFFAFFGRNTRHASFSKIIKWDNFDRQWMQKKWNSLYAMKKLSALWGKSTLANTFIAQMSFLFKCFLLCHILIPFFIRQEQLYVFNYSRNFICGWVCKWIRLYLKAIIFLAV
jgi:hypothetical protein